MRPERQLSPIRGALQTVWDLNIKAMPSAFIWAASCWFLLDTHSIFVRFLAVLIANLAALFSAIIIVKSERAKLVGSWKVLVGDPYIWKLMGGSGIILSLAIENVWRANHSNSIFKIIYLSIFVSSLIIWLFVTVVLVPIRGF
jgi:uncharacterized membrane protein